MNPSYNTGNTLGNLDVLVRQRVSLLEKGYKTSDDIKQIYQPYRTSSINNV
jgi:VanZ family protein